jgi:hypothetical protein
MPVATFSNVTQAQYFHPMAALRAMVSSDGNNKQPSTEGRDATLANVQPEPILARLVQAITRTERGWPDFFPSRSTS